MNSKSILKLPSQLNLGAILPGQYGEIVLPLRTSDIAFLNLSLTPKAIHAGFFLLKQHTNDCKNELNIVVKPGNQINIIVASYPQQTHKTTIFNGQLLITEQANIHTIKLYYRVELPKISCKKILENIQTKQKMIRIIINKAVTNQGRIMLHNQEDYSLTLQPDLLMTNTIADKTSPYLMKVNKTVLEVEPKDQFIVFMQLTTNIGFKQDFKGMKKCVLRNVLVLRTNSTVFWCLPIQIIVIYVKQPQMKE